LKNSSSSCCAAYPQRCACSSSRTRCSAWHAGEHCGQGPDRALILMFSLNQKGTRSGVPWVTAWLGSGFSGWLSRSDKLLRLYLDSVAFGLHAVAYHCIVDMRGAILTVRDVALNCDEGWILTFTFGNIGMKGLAGKILFRVKLIVDLSASRYE
jgi:hypothetical protein